MPRIPYHHITGPYLRTLLTTMGLNTHDAATYLNVTPRAVRTWIAGTRHPSAPHTAALLDLYETQPLATTQTATYLTTHPNVTLTLTPHKALIDNQPPHTLLTPPRGTHWHNAPHPWWTRVIFDAAHQTGNTHKTL